MRTRWLKPSFWWLNDKLRRKPMIQIDPWDRFIKRTSWTRLGKKRNINGRELWRKRGRVSASREVMKKLQPYIILQRAANQQPINRVRYHPNNPQRFTIPHHQLLSLPHDRTIQVLSIGGNLPWEPKLTTTKIAPSTENKVAKRTMGYPSFTNSSKSELKAPFCPENWGISS